MDLLPHINIWQIFYAAGKPKWTVHDCAREIFIVPTEWRYTWMPWRHPWPMGWNAFYHLLHFSSLTRMTCNCGLWHINTLLCSVETNNTSTVISSYASPKPQFDPLMPKLMQSDPLPSRLLLSPLIEWFVLPLATWLASQSNDLVSDSFWRVSSTWIYLCDKLDQNDVSCSEGRPTCNSYFTDYSCNRSEDWCDRWHFL